MILKSIHTIISSVPSPVQDVRSEKITSTSITITWKPPQTPNGTLQFYEINYAMDGEQPHLYDVQNTTTWKLICLEPYTQYTIKVRAMTMAGFGQYSLSSIVCTLEDGMLIFHSS